jgi:hypothetical protein
LPLIWFSAFADVPQQESQPGKFTSPPFVDGSRYGSYGFSFSVDKLLGCISAMWPNHKMVHRCLGTFFYPQETMHAVLICPEEEIFPTLPILDNTGYQPVSTTENDWKWSLNSSTDCGGSHYDVLTFAVFCKPEMILKLPSPSDYTVLSVQHTKPCIPRLPRPCSEGRMSVEELLQKALYYGTNDVNLFPVNIRLKTPMVLFFRFPDYHRLVGSIKTQNLTTHVQGPKVQSLCCRFKV